MPLGRARPANPHLEKVIGKEFDRRRPITSPTFFASDSVRPDAKKNKRRIIFVRQADGTFTGQYSDGANWQSFLATSVSFATPTVTYATAASAGTGSKTVRSDSVFKFPQAVMPTTSTRTLTALDGGFDPSTGINLQSSQKFFTLSTAVAGGIIAIDTTGGGASTNSFVVRMTPDPAVQSDIIQSQIDPANLNAGFVDFYNISCNYNKQLISSTIAGYYMTTFTVAPTAGSDNNNSVYGAKLTGPFISNATGGFTEVAALYLQAPRRLVSNPTVTAGYGAIVECPTVSATTQAGIYVKQRTAQQAATNRYGILLDGQNSGTNRYGITINGTTTGTPTLAIGLDIAAQGVGTTKYSIRTATDPEYFGGHVQMDDSVKVKLGTAQDAEVYYDGTDLILDPDVVGSGVVRHSGKTGLDDDTTIATGKNIILSTSGAGTKIGTGTTQLLGFWNSAPVVQPATTGTASSMVAGAGAAVDDQATFTGGTGATAYNIDDLVKNLKTCGILKT